jgi:hypothetical protein
MSDFPDCDDDWDDDPVTPPKEEPDCYDCSDSGCPACGYIDPDDPEHLKAVAVIILRDRIPMTDRTASDADLASIPAAAHAAIRELLFTAHINIDIRWPKPGEYSDESPF